MTLASSDAAALLRHAQARGLPSVRLTPDDGSTGRARCVVAWPSKAPLLSEVVPLFEKLGLRLAEHRPIDTGTGSGSGPSAVAEFHVRFTPTRLDPALVQLVEDAFVAAWAGHTEHDGLSRLVLAARLGWREIALLRAASRYLRQAGLPFSEQYVAETLIRRSDVARAIVALFAARFDPQGAMPVVSETDADIVGLLEQTTVLDEDKILRGLRHFVLAVVRTNYFQAGPDGAAKPHLSFKLDPSRLPFLPQPRPLFETYVYSPRTEGLHLRGGLVARGGIRWSDRPEDFRTEVLGLMKAQMVKNAVIVPAGAKGAFVVRRPLQHLDRTAQDKVVRDCYVTFIRGLLDITDNNVDGKIVHPPDTVVHDGPDPYLVVAADKGTATFSDLANSIAEQYGFWLGDAVAAGGSSGYDHKAMGITARGAWVSVRRHFRELGLDIDQEDFTVVGVGDMSGDVFGNGTLLSGHIRLLAAFDHRHVFLDPDPDPAASYIERRRLFDLHASSWADYNPAKISPGGGVYPRAAKAIPVTPQVREALAIDADVATLTPQQMIRAILAAPVDLLWNGGIGTYVKASDEPHTAIGDPSNDALRIDAAALRCKVVGEGGNLGLTQRGRIEYALTGGRINTDFIDNSAGVDTSDHEVNIKLLLASPISEGKLTRQERDRALAQVTDEIAANVLENNRLQVQAISTAEHQAPFLLDRHARLIGNLEQYAGLNRRLENLPDESEIAQRRARGAGLTRPEIAVLLAYSKNLVREELLASDVPEDPALSAVLYDYFPAGIRTRFATLTPGHPLAREITATQLANDLINHVGPGFLYRLEERTNAGTAHAARAFAIAREVFTLDTLWADIDPADESIPAQTQQWILHKTQRLLERSAVWLLRHRRLPLDVQAEVARFTEPARMLAGSLQAVLIGTRRERYDHVTADLTRQGITADLARQVAVLAPLSAVFDLAETATATGHDLDHVASVYFQVGAELQLDWISNQINDLAIENHWTLMAKAAIRDNLDALQRQLTVAALHTAEPSSPTDVVSRWTENNRTRIQRCLAIIADLRQQPSVDVAMLTVVLHTLRELAQTSA